MQVRQHEDQQQPVQPIIAGDAGLAQRVAELSVLGVAEQLLDIKATGVQIIDATRADDWSPAVAGWSIKYHGPPQPPDVSLLRGGFFSEGQRITTCCRNGSCCRRTSRLTIPRPALRPVWFLSFRKLLLLLALLIFQAGLKNRQGPRALRGFESHPAALLGLRRFRRFRRRFIGMRPINFGKEPPRPFVGDCPPTHLPGDSHHSFVFRHHNHFGVPSRAG